MQDEKIERYWLKRNDRKCLEDEKEKLIFRAF